MTSSVKVGVIKKFKKSAPKFQVTFRTPLGDLDRFIEVMFSKLQPLESGTIIIDEVVFEAKNLRALLEEDAALDRDLAMSTEPGDDPTVLLKAALSDWIDFLFIPYPGGARIYADHDEFITFYANSRSALNKMTRPLEEAGFALIKEWQREF